MSRYSMYKYVYLQLASYVLYHIILGSGIGYYAVGKQAGQRSAGAAGIQRRDEVSVLECVYYLLGISLLLNREL